MLYRIIILFFFSLFIFSCDQSTKKVSQKISIELENKYKNSGFALIYNEDLEKIKKYFTKEYKPYVIGKISCGKNKVKLNGSINWI